MSQARAPIAVIGTGYVGLVTAAGFAELGSDVWCVDIDAAKVERLRRGEVPIYEPGLERLLERNASRLHYSTELDGALEHARLLFVAVGTPPTHSGDADLSAVHAVVDALPASSEHALVMKSTVPCGTGAALRRAFAAQGKAGLAYVSCPEFLKEGSAVDDFMHPDRVVIGDGGDWAGDAVVELYAPLDAPLVRTDIASAEMVKLASNAFLATKISFINEIANVCEETGADVVEVARGMGLDDRIGKKFLQAGIGYGGSCFAPEQTLLVRLHGRTRLVRFEQLWELLDRCSPRTDAAEAMLAFGVGSSTELIEPDGLEVLSWPREGGEPRFLPVAALTRRPYQGELLEVATKMGRRVRTTPDHPWFVGDGRTHEVEVKLAFELGTEDWVPLAAARPASAEGPPVRHPIDGAIEAAGLEPEQLIARGSAGHVQALLARAPAARREVFVNPRGVGARSGDVRRSGALRLDEVLRAGFPWREFSLGTARNGAFVPAALTLDRAFWRIVGLYLAEGHSSFEPDGGAFTWSFHPRAEEHLVHEVRAYFEAHGIRVRTQTRPTARQVSVSSRLLGAFWREVLGLARNSYGQRLPDLVWDAPESAKWALLSGLWEGDGSWSLINGGPSVVLELGTVSDELADGVMRLLGDLGIICSRRIGRTARSTQDTHWIRVSGAEQIERAIEFVPASDRAGVLAAVGGQRKRIAPTGYRRLAGGDPWARIVRVRRCSHAGHVYSLEVPLSHSVLATGGVATSNCFPKDVDALKQLAGNSGYHFQLLTAVIEVNELQKRRVVGKLHRYLGGLVGKRVALLGLAFKPNTDDMREASSLVLSARLIADGALVSAYDPVAEEQARALVGGITFASSPLEAVDGADAVVLVTEWPEFLGLDWSEVAAAMAGDLVIDGRNALDPQALRAAGLRYEGVGGGDRVQAVILVGGEGTRLRPLTSTVPKPVVPLVDRPFISFMLEWLRAHGIDDVVMSCGFLASGVRNVLGDGSAIGLRLRFIEEPEPRGTAGAVKLAEPLLDERFLMLNGDVLTDIDLSAQMAQHERTGARATLALVPVADPTAYGLVLLDEDNSVREFVEKPSPDRVESNLISAGAYVLERDILELVPPDRNVSIEREVWPLLVGQGLYGFPADSYWLDIGTPERYLQGTFDIIEGNVQTAVRERLGGGWLALADDAEIDGRVIPPAVLERGVRVGPGAHIGSLAVLAAGVSVGPGSTVERAVILNGSQIGEGCLLRDCIVAAGCRVGPRTQITGGAVLGEGVTVGADNVITRGARIFPGVTLPDGAIRF